MITWLLLSFLAVVVVNSTYLYDPTQEEIERALNFQKPLQTWGFQARQEKNVRVLCVGGSNTEQGLYSKPLSAYLRNSSDHSWSGSLESRGEGGTSPLDFVGISYEFELRSKETWPNIVLLDFSMNTFRQVPMDKISDSVDSVIQTIKSKYARAGLVAPEFMFLELFFVRQCIYFMWTSPNATSFEAKMKLLNNLIPYEDIERQHDLLLGSPGGCPTCKEIRAVADFYGYPTVSWRLLGYNAFIRYFLNETLIGREYSQNPWIYSVDGLHFSKQGGQLITDTLFVPFFQGMMAPRKEKEKPLWSKEMRMFPPVLLPVRAASYGAWEGSFEIPLSKIIRQPSDWKVLQQNDLIDGHHHHGKNCIGSWEQNAHLHLDFVVPSVCESVGNCKVSIGFLHSWNESFVGDVQCTLTTASGKALTEKALIKANLHADHTKMYHTGMIQTDLNVTVSEGRHTISCSKLDSKFSCLVALNIAGSELF